MALLKAPTYFDMNTTYYLAGPMTGIPEYNYPAFREAAAALRDAGLHIESPHENPWPNDHEKMSESQLWQAMMDLSREQVNRSEAIILLPGWYLSSGALRELGWAKERKLPVYFYDTALKIIFPMARFEEGDLTPELVIVG